MSDPAESGHTIVLPDRPRRAWLRGFWAAVSVPGTALATAAGGLAGGPVWAALLGAAAAAVAAAGLLRPGLAARPYRVWNRVAGRVAGLVRSWVTLVTYGGLFTPAGRAGSGLSLRRPGPGGSVWSGRATLDPRAYASLEAEPAGGGDEGWVRSFLRWARRPRNWWSLFLLPALLLLRAVETGEGEETPEHIYTLY